MSEHPNSNIAEAVVRIRLSNDPYAIDPRPRHGTRGQINRGLLGVSAVTGPPPHGLEEWAARTFRVDSAASVSAGIDGESVAVTPPLLFESDPLALRLRLPVRRPPHPPRPPRVRLVAF
jgi:hypothetical protein